jgi:hypothetical protein
MVLCSSLYQIGGSAMTIGNSFFAASEDARCLYSIANLRSRAVVSVRLRIVLAINHAWLQLQLINQRIQFIIR